MFDKADSIKSG